MRTLVTTIRMTLCCAGAVMLLLSGSTDAANGNAKKKHGSGSKSKTVSTTDAPGPIVDDSPIDPNSKKDSLSTGQQSRRKPGQKTPPPKRHKQKNSAKPGKPRK